LIVVAGAAGIAWWIPAHRAAGPSPRGAAPGAADTAPEVSIAHVDVVSPKKGGITRTSTQIGTAHAFEAAELFAKVSGYLKNQTVDIGSRVDEGQLLAEIDVPEIVKERDRAAAALEQDKAQVLQATARIQTAQAERAAAEALVAKAKADIATYTATRKYRALMLKRMEDLFANVAVKENRVDEEREHYDAAVAAETSAQAAVVSYQAQVASATAKVEQAKADLAEARANVQVAQETLAKAQVEVDYTRIISPYKGVITRRSFHRGDFISAAQGGTVIPVLTVARTDKMRIVTMVPDRDAPLTDVGDRAIVTFDALKGETFQGTVARFSYAEDPSTRTMRTEIDLPNPTGRILQGMYGLATIILQENKDALTIPDSALVKQTGSSEAEVYVVREGKAHLTPIRIGADDGIVVEVLSGLSAADQVIVQHGTISEGTPLIASAVASTAAENPH
jgi:RND family efflux transporter MFP subunit